MNKSINIVIINWGSLDFLKITLDSLFKNTDLVFHLTIIDNNSNNDAKNFIKKIQKKNRCDGITKIFNEKNLGYSRAANLGLKESFENGYDFTCFCNNDLYFAENWLSGLLCEMNEDIVAVYPMGVSTYTSLNNKPTKGIFKNRKDKDKILEFLTSNKPENIKKILKENKSTVFDKFPQSLPDHCVLINNNFIQKIGFWADERYGLYGSNDIDICWEIFKRGKKIKETNKSFVYHFRHKSITENQLDRFTALKDTSQILYSKWRNEFNKEMKKTTFINDFFDLNNRDYKILRSINEKIHFIKQNSTILAVFGGLGKTTLASNTRNRISI